MLLKSKQKGFTLIELLVVISIISLLSSVVLASVNSARTKGKRVKARAEMSQIIHAVVAAENESGLRLIDITGSGCTSCTTPAAAALATALTKITQAGGNVFQNISNISLDPWGNVYQLDENEGESGCRNDTLVSSGAGNSTSYCFPFFSNACQSAANTCTTGSVGWQGLP